MFKISCTVIPQDSLDQYDQFGVCMQGEKGDMGVEGEQGEKGETGLKGKEGPPGDPGLVGIRVSYFSVVLIWVILLVAQGVFICLQAYELYNSTTIGAV